MTYARDTTVPIYRSKAEIESMLRAHGAVAFEAGWNEEARLAWLQYKLRGRVVRHTLRLPDRAEFETTPQRRQRRSPALVTQEYEKGVRQRWRALLVLIKGKLAAVEAGITTFEAEFLANLVLPEGPTVGETFVPQLEEILEAGAPILALGSRGEPTEAE